MNAKNLGSKRLDRRALLGGAAGLAAGSAAMRMPQSASAQETTLDFTVWSYGEDVIQDNIGLFQEANPGVTVNLSSFAWEEFHTTMVNRFTSGTPTDVSYNGGNWLEEFAAAGWVVPLDASFDWVAGYQEKVLPFAWQDMTFNGQVWRSMEQAPLDGSARSHFPASGRCWSSWRSSRS